MKRKNISADTILKTAIEVDQKYKKRIARIYIAAMKEMNASLVKQGLPSFERAGKGKAPSSSYVLAKAILCDLLRSNGELSVLLSFGADD